MENENRPNLTEQEDGMTRFFSYESFKEALFDYEKKTVTSYNIVKETANFKEQSIETLLISRENKPPSICWEHAQGNEVMPLPYNGTPYIFLGSRTYQCHQGKDWNANKKWKYQDKKNKVLMGDHSQHIKTHHSHQDTKKLDCPVVFQVKKIHTFPEHAISSNTKWHRTAVSKKIKELLKPNQPIPGRIELLTIFPKGGHVGHVLGEAAGFIEPLDERVVKYIKSLARSGCRRVKDVSSRVEEFVNREILIDDPSFDRSAIRRKFFPSRKTIKNIMYRVKMETRYSHIDEINLYQLSEHWRANANIYFNERNKNNCESDSIANEIDSCDEDEQEEESDNVIGKKYLAETTSSGEKFMYVYQSDFMKRMYRRYGNNLVLLDATYKTTLYALPLFFLVVQTNVNFLVVAVILVEEESVNMIERALGVIKEWNPDVCPKYGMTDFDGAEILSLCNTFPGIKTFLCDFHREQAWNRWATKKKNGVSHVESDVKARLRRIASAIDEKELDDAIKSFQSWPEYKDRLKKWFEGTWLPEKEKWTLAYRPNDLILCNTNNGTERLNEDLKYEELNRCTTSSLSELMTIIVNEFLPKHRVTYTELNIRYCSEFRKYQSSMPVYLHNRPLRFRSLVLEKIGKVTQNMINSVKVVSEKKFQVDSLSIMNLHHDVNFGSDEETISCSCRFFRRYRFLCTHILAVIKIGIRRFQDLSPLFLKHPCNILDETLFESTQATPSEGKEVTPPLDSLNSDFDSGDIEQANTVDVDITDENSLSNENDSENENYNQNIPVLPDQKSIFKRKKLNLLAILKNATEKCHNIKEVEENILHDLTTQATAFLQTAENYLKRNNGTFIERGDNVDKIQAMKRKNKTPGSSTGKSKLPKRKRYSHPFSSRVGTKADMLKQYYKAKLSLEEMMLPKQKNRESQIQSETMELLEKPEDFSNEVIIDVIIEENIDSSANELVNEVVIAQNPDASLPKEEISLTKIVPGKEPRRHVKEMFSEFMSEQITQSKMLQHDVINYSMGIMARQFPTLFGFEDTGLNPSQFSTVSRNFIEILHVQEKSHWITIARKSSSEVNVFDSLNTKIGDIYPRNTLKSIAKIAGCKDPTLRLNFLPVQRQSNYVDCGVYAIAFAVEKAFGHSPHEAHFNEKEMRPFLIKCLKNKVFEPFPKTLKRTLRCVSYYSIRDVYCICRSIYFENDYEFDTGLFMAMCSQCEEWYHKKCLKIPKKVFSDESVHQQWKCIYCD